MFHCLATLWCQMILNVVFTRKTSEEHNLICFGWVLGIVNGYLTGMCRKASLRNVSHLIPKNCSRNALCPFKTNSREKIQLVSLQSMVKVNFQRHKMQLREHYCYTTSTGSRGEFCFPFQLTKISHMPESLEPPFLVFFLVILVLLKE